MNLTDITSYAKTTLESVNGVGKVYDITRNSKTETEFRETFVKDAVLNSWLIVREGLNVEDGQNIGTLTETHQMVIRGYYAYQEGVSERILQDLTTNILQAFNSLAARRFHDDVYWSGPMQAPLIVVGTFGSKLAHIVRLTWPVQAIEGE